MIGHALLMFTPDQEDRVLTEPMGPCGLIGGTPCLLQVACDLRKWWESFPADGSRPGLDWRSGFWSIAYRYDHLCDRFGTARVNAAIRERVLRNRLYREMPRNAATKQAIAPVVKRRTWAHV